MGMESLRRSNADPDSNFEGEVARFLTDRGICKTPSEAADKAFLLLVSSKGLFLKSRTTEEFQAGMSRIIAGAT